MDSHKSISASGMLYGFGFCFFDGADFVAADELSRFVGTFAKFAELDELKVPDELEAAKDADELEAARVQEELLTAGVICCSLDDDSITLIVVSDELDSGIYWSIW